MHDHQLDVRRQLHRDLRGYGTQVDVSNSIFTNNRRAIEVSTGAWATTFRRLWSGCRDLTCGQTPSTTPPATSPAFSRPRAASPLIPSTWLPATTDCGHRVPASTRGARRWRPITTSTCFPDLWMATVCPTPTARRSTWARTNSIAPPCPQEVVGRRRRRDRGQWWGRRRRRQRRKRWRRRRRIGRQRRYAAGWWRWRRVAGGSGRRSDRAALGGRL